jgi:hypothetical protein
MNKKLLITASICLLIILSITAVVLIQSNKFSYEIIEVPAKLISMNRTG